MKKRILIVEDEKIIAEDIKLYVIKFGYEVVGIAATGEEAIQQTKDFMPDLLLMDIWLEDRYSGLEAAKKIYQKFRIPIIFLTAYSDDTVLEKATESIPYGYLLKPINEKELWATLKMTFYKIDKEEGVIQDFPSRIKKVRKYKKQKKIKDLIRSIKEKIFFK